MIKESVINMTQYHYYCDVCQEEQREYREGDIDDLLKECRICHKDICPKCRISIRTDRQQGFYQYLCKSCAIKHQDLVDAFARTMKTYCETMDNLMEKLLSLSKESKP